MAHGCTCARFATAGSKSDAWNASKASPSVVVPSGKMPTQSPCASAARTRTLMRAASRLSPRRMNSVPACSAIQPASGQSRTSLLATNRVGRTAWMAKMSSHETWFAAIIAPASDAGGGSPSSWVATPTMRSSFAAHQPTSARRRAASARGNTSLRTSAAAAACATLRAQRSARSARPARGLMRDPSRVAPGEHAHAIAGAERLVGLLHHRDVLARVEQHGELDTRHLVARALDVVPDDAADDGAANGADDLAVPAPRMAAGDSAQEGAGRAAHAGVARLDAHHAPRLDHAESHRLLAHHLVAAIVAAAAVVRATRHQRARERARRHLEVSHMPSYSWSPNASRSRRAISSRDGLWFCPPRRAILIDPITEARRAQRSQPHSRDMP